MNEAKIDCSRHGALCSSRNSRWPLHLCLFALLTRTNSSEPSTFPKPSQHTHNHEKPHRTSPPRAPRASYLHIRRLRLAKRRQMRPALPPNQQRLGIFLQTPSQRRLQVRSGRNDDPITLVARGRWLHGIKRQSFQSRSRELLLARAVPAVQVVQVTIPGNVRQHQEQMGLPHAALRHEWLSEVHYWSAIELGEVQASGFLLSFQRF